MTRGRLSIGVIGMRITEPVTVVLSDLQHVGDHEDGCA